MNVFEHQRFLLRRPDGTRLTRSFREILTATADDGTALDPDEVLRLDYPHAHYDVAAFGLMQYLVHLAFDPADGDEVARRLETPVSPDEFDRAVAPFLPTFSIDAPPDSGRLRFMQGAPPEPQGKRGKLPKPDPVGVLSLTIRKDNSQNKMEWLNRPDDAWAIDAAQIPLALFARNTFYEGAGGAGYQKGTAGEVPVRALLAERPAEARGAGGEMLLRRSLWLNVLHREYRAERYAADFAFGPDPYAEKMWETPPDDHVRTGEITLAAGLGWMVASHYLRLETLGPGEAICLITGRPIDGLAATGVWKSPTGIAYGTKGDADARQRASRLFRHPNAPTYDTYDKKLGTYANERQHTVDRTRGLIEVAGALFFGQAAEEKGRRHHLAPVQRQLADPPDGGDDLEDYVLDPARRIDLDVFGFHMIGSMGGKHSGYERHTVRYPILRGTTPEATRTLYDQAQRLMHDAAERAHAVAGVLERGMQETAGVAVTWSEKTEAKGAEEGRARINVQRRERKTAADFAFGRDELAAFWDGVSEDLATLAFTIAEVRDPATLADQRDALLADFGERITARARRIYRPVFDAHSTALRTMPFAHRAKGRFDWSLRQAA